MKSSTFAHYQPKMNMAPIKAALGDDHPEIHPTPLGRYRLISALRNKHGENYKNVPLAKRALEHFDKEHEYFRKLRKIQGS